MQIKKLSATFTFSFLFFHFKYFYKAILFHHIQFFIKLIYFPANSTIHNYFKVNCNYHFYLLNYLKINRNNYPYFPNLFSLLLYIFNFIFIQYLLYLSNIYYNIADRWVNDPKHDLHSLKLQNLNLIYFTLFLFHLFSSRLTVIIIFAKIFKILKFSHPNLKPETQ